MQFYIHVYILPVSDFCQSEIRFGVQWPRTKTGEEITVECSLADSIFTGIIKLHVLIDLCHSGAILGFCFSVALSTPIFQDVFKAILLLCNVLFYKF